MLLWWEGGQQKGVEVAVMKIESKRWRNKMGTGRENTIAKRWGEWFHLL